MLLILLGAVLLWFAPEERTLGHGIKPVYIHVAFTWTGLLGLTLAGLVGVVVFLTASQNLNKWLVVLFKVGFRMFTAGFLLSVLASVINWGGFPFQEPRAIIAMNTLAVGVVVYVFLDWNQSIRLTGVLSLIPILVMELSLQGSRLVLHPDNPVNSAPPNIKSTFYLMFGLTTLFAVWWGRSMYLKDS